MKPIYVLWGFLGFLLLLLITGVVLVVLAVEDAPLVDRPPELKAEQIFRAKKLWDENNPRMLGSGQVKTLELTQTDLDLIVGYGASRWPGSGASLVLRDHGASLALTVRLPSNPLGSYLNLRAVLRETGRVPSFEFLQIGKVTLPGSVGDWAVSWALTQGSPSGEPPVTDLIRELRVSGGRLTVTYEWNDAAALGLKSSLVPADERERWRLHQARLNDLVETKRNKALSLADLIGPMMAFAAERGRPADLKAERRAALIVLGSYLAGKGLDLLVPEAKTWPVPPQVTVTLGGRDDFPRHYALSAALAAAAGSPLADVVGVFKELQDTKGGSGFSFNDLAADRAGTRFGEAAVGVGFSRDPASGLSEADIFPEWKDLPEFLTAEEFQSRYGGQEDPRYKKLAALIEDRIAALPVFRR